MTACLRGLFVFRGAVAEKVGNFLSPRLKMPIVDRLSVGKRRNMTMRSWLLVVGGWLLVVASVVGTYELGYQRGQIAALSEEVGK